MARKIPQNLSPAAKEKLRQLAGFREFHAPDQNVYQVKKTIIAQKETERKLSAFRKASARLKPVDLAAFNAPIIARGLKDKRREKFDELMNLKGERGDPLLSSINSINQIKEHLGGPSHKWAIENLKRAHQKKLAYLKAQKK